MNTATVKIQEAPISRQVTTSKGALKTIHYQKASLETEQMRIQIDVEIDGPNMGYPVGKLLEWDLAADLVPGRFGPELARRMTLREPAKASAARAA